MPEKESLPGRHARLQIGEPREKELPTSPRFELVTMTWDPITDGEEVKDIQDFDRLAYPIEPHKHVFVRRGDQLYRVYSFIQILAPTETTEKTIEVGVVGQQGKTEKRTYGVAAEEIRDEPFTFHFDRTSERLAIKLNATFLSEYGLTPLQIDAPSGNQEDTMNIAIEKALFSGGSIEVLPGNPATLDPHSFLRVRGATTSGNIKEMLIRQIEVEQEKVPTDLWDPTEGLVGSVSIEQEKEDTQKLLDTPTTGVDIEEYPVRTGKMVIIDAAERLKRYSAREVQINAPKRNRLRELGAKLETIHRAVKTVERENRQEAQILRIDAFETGALKPLKQIAPIGFGAAISRAVARDDRSIQDPLF
jgi:hypothetical protein